MLAVVLALPMLVVLADAAAAAPDSERYVTIRGRGPVTMDEDDRGWRHFRVAQFGQHISESVGDWAFKLCFEGTATPNVDYKVHTHFAEEYEVALDLAPDKESGCTAERQITGGSDRYHFYISHIDDSIAEGDETIEVIVTIPHRLHPQGGRKGFQTTEQAWRMFFTIVDDETSGQAEQAEQSSLSQPADEEASPQQTEQSCVSDSLLADVQGYAGETWRESVDHVERWERVLAAFGETSSYNANPMTATEAQTYADRGWNRWVPVVTALECVDTTPDEQPEAQAETQPAQEPTPPPPVTPQVSIAAGADIAEGTDATFTVTATPAPASDLDVAVDVSQHGSYAGTGTRTLTITTSGSTTFAVATTDDSVDEPDGSITATLGAGSGYTVSATGSDATVAVSDDDVPQISIAAVADVTEGEDAVFTITADPAPHAGLSVDVAITQTGDHGAATGTRTVTIPTSGTYTLTVATTDDSTDETDGSVTATVNTASGYDVSATAGAATIAVSDDDDTPPDDPPAEDTSDSGTVPAGPPTVTVSDATADEGSQELRFAVTLSHPNPRDITFRYGGYGRTATLWQDWSIEFRRTFTLAAGDTAIDITVPVIDDNTPENRRFAFARGVSV